MPTTASNNITRTEASVDSLKFAHNRLVVIEQIITEEAWFTMMLEHGMRYATIFSNLYGKKADDIYKLLVNAPAAKGDTNNWFWMWWRFKWMYDDWDYVTNKVQRMQGISYEHYKCYLLNCETLEQDLLSIMQDKHFLLQKI